MEQVLQYVHPLNQVPKIPIPTYPGVLCKITGCYKASAGTANPETPSNFQNPACLLRPLLL